LVGVSPDQVRENLRRLGVADGARLAVAVSGGADSTALLHLVECHYPVAALTVDHGLRPEAAAEAEGVKAHCAALGVPHETLRWEGEKPEGNLQAEARDARYGLLKDWCLQHGVEYLLTAHHQDDQAETLLMRLARGSGVYGLAGMAPTRDLGGVTLLRPLLDVPKTALVEYLEDKNINWTEDPSNQADRFDRVKIRQFLENPPLEGFQSERLAATAARLRRTRDALEFYEAMWLDAAADAHSEGYVFLKASGLESAPEEVVLRGIASICRHVAGGIFVPRMEKLLRLYEALTTDGFSGQTLYGTQISRAGTDRFLFSRELAAIVPEISVESSSAETITWDNRFEIRLKGAIAGIKIRPLGDTGWAQLVGSGFGRESLQMPRVAALALPALFVAGDLQAVPQLGYNKMNEVSAQIVPIRPELTKK